MCQVAVYVMKSLIATVLMGRESNEPCSLYAAIIHSSVVARRSLSLAHFSIIIKNYALSTCAF